jgi:hypothetical protein
MGLDKSALLFFDQQNLQESHLASSFSQCWHCPKCLLALSKERLWSKGC